MYDLQTSGYFYYNLADDGTSGFAYRRLDGVNVVPMSALTAKWLAGEKTLDRLRSKRGKPIL